MQLPHGQLLTVAGTGHDVLDSDITGCAARALKRFAGGQQIGTPCAGRDNAVGVLARPPSDRRLPSRTGVAGDRGRVLFAALDTSSMRRSPRCRRSRRLLPRPREEACAVGASRPRRTCTLRLHRYELVPGLRMSGVLRASDSADAGT